MPPSIYYAVLLALVLGVGCGPRVLTPDEMNVVGTYEGKMNETDEDVSRMVFLKNGVMETYTNDKKDSQELEWEIIEGEVVSGNWKGQKLFFRVEPNGDLRIIGVEENGERMDFQKDMKSTFKKIK